MTTHTCQECGEEYTLSRKEPLTGRCQACQSHDGEGDEDEDTSGPRDWDRWHNDDISENMARYFRGEY